MSGPDGLEQRTADLDERIAERDEEFDTLLGDSYERDIDDADVTAQLADGDCDCDEGRYCDAHFQEALAEHAYLRHVPRHQVIHDERSREEYAQELRDAGRGEKAAVQL